MKVFRFSTLIAVVLGLFALAGCGGQTGSVAPLADSPQGYGALPDIWSLEAAGSREVNAVGDTPITVLGDEQLLDSNAIADGEAHTLTLYGNGQGDTSEEQLAWGLYKVEGLSDSLDLQTLSVQATPAGPHDSFYVGLADFSHGRWEFHGPVTIPELEIDLSNNSSRYISGLGNLYFLVVTEHAVVTHLQTTLSFAHHEEGHDNLPGQPYHLTATDGAFEDHVGVTWEGGDGATRFDIYRRLDGGHAELGLIGTSESHEYSDGTAEPGVMYVYRALAVNAEGHSGFSNSDGGYAGSMHHGDDDCPSELVASDHLTDLVRLEWHGLAESSYHVYRKVHGHEGEFDLIGVSSGQSFDDASAEDGLVYDYKVSGQHADESECFSNVDTGTWTGHSEPQGCPTELTASKGEHGNVVALAWQGDHALTYDVYRRLDGSESDFEFLAHAEGLEYLDHAVEAAHVYIYKIRLGQSHEEECWSNTDHGYVVEGH
jgi:hypothetical protein